MRMEDKNHIVKDDEIDLVELVRVFWSKRKFLIKLTSVFFLSGVLIAFTTPNSYRTSCTLIPEAMNSQSPISGSLGGLASLAGIDLGGVTGEGATINPGLYRSIAQSTPFLYDLMYQEFYFNDLNSRITLYDYYFDHYKLSIFQRILLSPVHLISFFKSSEEGLKSVSKEDSPIVSLTKDEKIIGENLAGAILVTMDWELNVVTIEVEMQDPVVAAEVAEFTRKYITNYVIDYSLTKSNKQLEFVEKQYISSQKDFELVQLMLANFRDRNKNINTAKAQSELEKLQSEYNLAFNIYNQLAQQREQIKLQRNENTPVFTVLEPVKIPVEKSSPKRVLILVLFTFVGIITSVGLVTVKSIYRS